MYQNYPIVNNLKYILCIKTNTEYYLQLTKDVFPEIADKIETLYSDIIPDKIGEDNI